MTQYAGCTPQRYVNIVAVQAGTTLPGIQRIPGKRIQAKGPQRKVNQALAIDHVVAVGVHAATRAQAPVEVPGNTIKLKGIAYTTQSHFVELGMTYALRRNILTVDGRISVYVESAGAGCVNNRLVATDHYHFARYR